LNHESDKIVKLQRHQFKDAVLEMGSYAVEATKREIRNHHIAWTTDHWTGQDKATYTTVTAHWIGEARKVSPGQWKRTWVLHRP